MKLEFRKGTETLSLQVPDSQVTAVLSPQSLPVHPDQDRILKDAMEHPIGTPALKEIVHKGETIAIITSDNTRPVPTARILPFLLKDLDAAGIEKKDITLYFALGSHRHMSEEERNQLAGTQDIACMDSDPEHVTYLGTTARGTPVEIDSRILKADRRICIGNVEYHYFAGYSGGAKAILPGMTSAKTIAANHSLMADPGACAGTLQNNPVREDLEEGCSMAGTDFILNVVLNPQKEIIHASAGDVTGAHRDACRYLDTAYRSPIPALADIVIVSQGGSPKDRNLYQTQKALDNAKYAVKDGGTIILVGSCREGFGQQTFEEWMLKYQNPSKMKQALQEHFVLGGHKACAIAKVREKADIFLVSDMKAEIIRKTFMTPFSSLEEAYQAAVQKQGENASVIAMPYGGSTLPVLQ